ncbi:MAG TPA: hypothetical protein VFC34_02300, partial [Puia sp.]|nr:hypothetical protein [Puia sp.]
ENKPLVHYLITGLIAVTAVGQWIVLFFPLRLFFFLFVLLLCLLFTFLRRKTFSAVLQKCISDVRQKNRLFFFCLLCFLMMVLVLNAGPVMMDDTDSYHIQMVKWIQEFGSVPGIANLHLRFGFNSSWFVSAGLLTFPVHGLNTYISLNGLLAFWFCYYLLEKCFVFSQKAGVSGFNNQWAACLVILIICLANWPMIRGCASSLNYDFISTCCVVILFVDLASGTSKFRVEWFIWPVYLFTVRMMNFPLLILSLFYFLQGFRPFQMRRLIFCITGSVVLIVPFLIRNTILSGYPFFPVYQLDFFSFDWKADKSYLVGIGEYIKYFNRVNPTFLPISETRQLAFPGWVGAWFKYLFFADRWLVIFSFAGYFFIIVRIKQFFLRPQLIFTMVMIIQLIFWFLVAPDPRFVQGSLLFGIYAAIQNGPYFYTGLKHLLKISFYLIASATLIYGVSKMVTGKNYRNFLTPHPLPVPAVQSIVVDQIELHIPARVLNNWNPRCYDIALPCLYKLDPRLEARGKTVSDGFRLKPGSADQPFDGEYKIKD